MQRMQETLIRIATEARPAIDDTNADTIRGLTEDYVLSSDDEQ